jgi:hypothetical protein
MKKRIVDHKPILMTDSEFKMYKDLCRSYDRPNFKGEDLFIDHFVTNDDGVIITVKPPTQRYSSLEVYCFLISLMTNQHLRLMRQEQETLVSETKKNLENMVLAYQKKLDEYKPKEDIEKNKTVDKSEKETILEKAVQKPKSGQKEHRTRRAK